MKRYLLILSCLALIVYINGDNDKDCFKVLKTKAQSLKQYVSYKKAETVKQIVKEIINGLKKCEFSKADIDPFKKFEKDIQVEIKKFIKAQKELRVIFYSEKITGMLNVLESKYPQLQPGPSKKEVEKQTTPKGKAQQEEKPGETKIETSFPAEAYDQGKDPPKTRVKDKISVITAGRLKNGLNLLEKQVAYLSGTVTFYHYAFIFIIIVVFVLVGLMVLFGLLLRRQTRKSQHIEQQMKLMRETLEYYRKKNSGGM